MSKRYSLWAALIRVLSTVFLLRYRINLSKYNKNILTFNGFGSIIHLKRTKDSS